MHINHPPPGQATKTKWKATQEEVSPQGGRTLYCLGSTHLPMAWIRTPAITHGMTHGMTHHLCGSCSATAADLLGIKESGGSTKQNHRLHQRPTLKVPCRPFKETSLIAQLMEHGKKPAHLWTDPRPLLSNLDHLQITCKGCKSLRLIGIESFQNKQTSTFLSRSISLCQSVYWR